MTTATLPADRIAAACDLCLERGAPGVSGQPPVVKALGALARAAMASSNATVVVSLEDFSLIQDCYTPAETIDIDALLD